MKWKSTLIPTQSGSKEGIAPEIISASRSTDIPAFYSEWFINRLKTGYSKWINPFNRKAHYVSFQNTRVIIFWSKNPKPIVPFLKILDEKKIAYYFQFTVNDYEADGLEPGVPKLTNRVDTFRAIADRIGPERVIWRFDPLILTDSLGIDDLLDKIVRVGSQLSNYTTKLVFSFADVARYKRVQFNLRQRKIKHRDFTVEDIELLSLEISRLCASWKIPAYTCGESVDLSKYKIAHNKCIDDKLILKITNNHPDILRLFQVDKTKQLNLFPSGVDVFPVKDQGQRSECCCVISKDIGQYNTCLHNCVYCYANSSEKVARSNFMLNSPDGESIVY